MYLRKWLSKPLSEFTDCDEDSAAERKHIDSLRRDQDEILSLMAEFGVETEELRSPRPAVRRPKTLATLKAESKSLASMNAWLHVKLSEVRGEPPFAAGSGFDTLYKAGLVGLPSRPRTKTRGRPTKEGVAKHVESWRQAIIKTQPDPEKKGNGKTALLLAIQIVEALSGKKIGVKNIYALKKRGRIN